MTTNRVGAGPMLNGDPVIATLLNLIAAPDGAGAEVPMDLDAAAWQKLAGDALRNGVAPLVWTRLRELTHSAALPGAARQDLERSRMRVGVDNLRLYGRLATVLSSLETAGIDVIVLKGAFLSEVVYPDRALRSMSDVDLLVHREDLKRTAALLRELGWCQPAGNAAAPPPVAGHQLPTFVLAGVQIEIHWAIEDEESPFRVDTPGLWCRAVPVRIAGASAFGLAPEDLLLHLCLHTAYGHGWLQFSGGLRHLCDIAATIRHYRGRLDWTAFVSRAHSWGIARSAWLALAVARELVRAEVSAATLDSLAAPDPELPRLVDLACRLTLGAHYTELVHALPVFAQAWMHKGWCNRSLLARWRTHLIPSPKSLAAAYPSLCSRAVAPVRYLAHWVDLGRECASVVVNRDARLLRALEQRRWAMVNWFESPVGRSAAAAVTYREATPCDSAAAARVNVQSWRESFAGMRPRSALRSLSVEQRTELFRRRFDADFYKMFVAEAQGEGIIGFVDVGRPREFHDYDAELYALYVRKRFQRQGIGAKLFEMGVQAIVSNGMGSLYLIVLQDSPYRAFYEKMGGCFVAKRHANSRAGQDAHAIYAWNNLRAIRSHARSSSASAVL